MIETKRRSMAKGITYRISASGATVLTAWIITGNVGHATSIAVLDFFIKLAIYFFNDRAWGMIPWGIKSQNNS